MLQKPVPIPFPLSSFPGTNPQEGGGRLINCYAQPLEEASRPTGPARQKWIGSPGLLQHAVTAQSGYRGGLLVKNLSYEIFHDTATTVDANGVLNVLGTMLGTKLVSIARNQAATPDVVAVDVDNGAYQLSTGGAPASYNGGGNLPQPNSVCNQDGYFFFTIADGRCFASGLNALTQNALTFITCQAKADVTLLRGIPFSSALMLFTTGGCEIWQDAAIPAPGFPYSRSTVIEYGLMQSGAIAGNETGFSELLWVAQDHGVYWLTPGSLSPVKVSPPDLDKLIEDAIQASKLLDAGCYIAGGKKFWHISSPDWSWEFNLSTRKWSERQSYSGGQYIRWRAVGGHPAFSRWLVGDKQSGNILYPDDDTFAENGAPMLFRMESGATRDFPESMRIARADFDFVFGTGLVEGNYVMTVTGAAAGTGGVVRLAVNQTVLAKTGDEVQVAGVTGTTEANGTFPVTVVDGTHIELQGTVFAHAYVSGGTATDISVTSNAANPSVAISCSKDGGWSYDNPSVRLLQPQRKTRRSRATVKNRGQATAPGVRWRIDITDPVYRSLLGGTMSNNPREVLP
jgi:hypothetical protein